jgi:hypothetical protein
MDPNDNELPLANFAATLKLKKDAFDHEEASVVHGCSCAAS